MHLCTLYTVHYTLSLFLYKHTIIRRCFKSKFNNRFSIYIWIFRDWMGYNWIVLGELIGWTHPMMTFKITEEWEENKCGIDFSVVHTFNSGLFILLFMNRRRIDECAGTQKNKWQKCHFQLWGIAIPNLIHRTSYS